MHAELPSLRTIFKLGGPKGQDFTTWYDCKFYPYASATHPPVFAVTGGCHTVICRCVLQKDNSIEVLRWFKDDDPDARLNSLCWSRAPNGDPLVCVSGESPLIKILNVKTGKIETTLAGHGENINDIAVSPIDEYILATASKDRSIRLWSLDPAHSKQRTAAICHGEGHRDEVLAIGFHRNGRYLLSGGVENRVNLWHIPEIQKGGTLPDKIKTIHYPHFSSTEVHFDYIDCIQFYNDLIISRQAREGIIIWKIDNFNSMAKTPPDAPIPSSNAVRSEHRVDIPTSTNLDTRSAWGGRFQRLLSFNTPEIEKEFYLRFSLFHRVGHAPILAAGNKSHSNVFFWDLERLETAGVGEPLSLPANSKTVPTTTKASSSTTTTAPNGPSTTTGVSNPPNSTTTTTNPPRTKKKQKLTTNQIPDEKTLIDRGISDPFFKIKPHKTVTIPKYTLTGRQVAWSVDGEWCVVAGDHGLIAVLHRDLKEDGEG